MKDKPVILVVDDQPQNIELLEAYLAVQGYEIVSVASGEEALEKLSGNSIDLILLDVMMPGMDGFAVTRRIRQDKTHRLLPIILITALRETEYRIKGIEAGCDDFISKPFDKMELLARVRSLLKVKAYNELMNNYRKELESEVAKRTEELKFALENLQQEIIERKRAEAERQLMEKQLFQAQKMEAVGTMAGGIAHDFNNILGIIIGYTELALSENSPEQQREYLQETLNGSERAKGMIKQLLTFSRRDSQEKEPLDVNFLLKESVKFLRASIPTTVEIRQHLTKEPCNILADPTQMHQIIMNLCTNATHAMKKTGGTLKIELATMEMAEGDLPPDPDLKPGHYVQLTVSDTGHGIDSAHIKRIFDPFFTTKPNDEGTGLGLSVVYGIVKNHNGIINVYSKTGEGATFNVYLPRIINTETVKVDSGKLVAGGTERILFVDDEPALVDIGKHMLSSLGYAVTGVTSSVEALELFCDAPQRFDLVITDMTLPKMTGVDLAREILQIRPDMPIVLCSGIREPDTEDQVKSLGIKAYCMKPLTKKKLAVVIRGILDDYENTKLKRDKV